MGKMHAIGYSVCHQIPSHSFKIGELTFPLCSRCMGVYLGVFFGLMILLTQGRKSGIPSWKYLIIFGVFVAAWLVDGANSFFNGWLGKIILYPPNNTLRLITGFGMGLSMALVVFILFNRTVWVVGDIRSPLENPLILAAMFYTVSMLINPILGQNEILMTILAYLSTGTVVLLLTLLYSIVWMIILHKENS